MICSGALGQLVDPVRELTPTPLAGRERLGEAVASLPGVVICGAPGFEAQGTDAGGVLVFRFDRGSNVWRPDPWLTVPGARAGDGFGAVVAAAGSSIAVGSSSGDTVAIFDAADMALPPVVLDGGSDFGRSIAIDDNTLVVGEPQRSGTIGAGQAVVFQRIGQSVWTPVQVLTVAGLELNAGLGTSIAMRANRLIVGAPNAFGTGAAFLFTRSDDGELWSLVEVIQPSTLAPGDLFGSAVAIGTRELVVGAPGADVSASNSGAAYVIPLSVATGEPGEASELVHPTAAANALFGSAVAAQGDLIAISAPLGDGFAGESWVYRREPDESFVPRQRLAASEAEPFAGFGTALAISDEFILAGAPRLDASPFEPDAGSVSVYSSLAALGLAGDCDGNGTDDLVDLFITRTAADCNGNGRIDICEIADNPGLDSDGDGLLDGCVVGCPADLNFDGLLSPADFAAWLLNYNLGCP